MSNGTKSTWQLIQLPAVITFIITLLRLIGERLQWSPLFFSTKAGGGFAVVGIVWLVPIFGIYFAMKLACQGAAPEGKAKALIYNIVGILIVVAGGFAMQKMEYLGYVILLVSWFIFAKSWGSLTRTLLAYGFAARVPVFIVMIIATANKWVTHYSAYPELPQASSLLGKLWHGAFLPQMIAWVTFTVAIGGLFGIIASFFVKKQTPGETGA
jgi:hypothetical protein